MEKYFTQCEDGCYKSKNGDPLFVIFTYYRPHLWQMWESEEFREVRSLDRGIGVKWADMMDNTMCYSLNKKEIGMVVKCMKRYKKKSNISI